MSVLVKEVPKAIANQLLLGTVTYSFIYLLKGSQKYYKAEVLRSKTVGVTALEFEFIQFAEFKFKLQELLPACFEKVALPVLYAYIIDTVLFVGITQSLES